MSEHSPDVTVVLPGEPKGKGAPRARVVTAGGRAFAQIYPDPETKSYEGMLRQVGALAMRSRNPLAGALRVRVTAHMSVPTSWPERKKAAAFAGYVRPTVRPDWENIAKTLDALTGVVWIDDKQIVSGVIEKFYAAKPQLVVDVWEQRGALI
jgi:Holliday junction resolvase RusA-like endonuclease